jgi:eukaryotic-like serine/threonine-protein kinase
MQPGELIHERYALEAPIGRGGMAEVWRAHDRRLDRPVAIKFLAPGLSDQPEFLVRLFNEAQSVASISHPHVTQVLDYGTADRGPYLVMEYVSGGSVSDLTGDPLPAETAIDIMIQVAAGAGAAHDRGIVHRDIKPGNILLSEHGVVKLADFGIASSEAAMHLTATGAAIGSAHYISPEQAMGEHATPAADVYSMGVVLYELLTGRLPFEGGNATAVAIAHVETEAAPPSSVIHDLDPHLDAVVMRCLAKEPQERYANGSELSAALEAILSETTSVPSPERTAVGPPVGDTTSELVAADAPTGDETGSAWWRSDVVKKSAVALAVAASLAAIAIHLTSQPSVAEPRPKSPRPAQTHRPAPTPSRSAAASTTLAGEKPTPTAAPTSTPTPTATPSKTPKTPKTPRPKPSPSPKARPTPAPSATTAPAPTPSPTAAPNPTPSPTAVATPTAPAGSRVGERDMEGAPGPSRQRHLDLQAHLPARYL